MQRSHLLALFSLLLPAATLAQTTPGGVRIGVAGTPDAKAILDLSATGKGLLIPRMDSVSRVGIGTPPDGLMVFQTDGRKGFWYAMNAAWLFIPDKARSGDNLGNHTATQNLNLADKLLVGNGGAAGLSIGSTGNVGLGTTAAQPATQRLDVRGNLRLGDDGGFNATGTGQAIEWVGPGVNTDPVGLYRVNPASDASELRVVVGDGADANDKFAVGRMNGTSNEGGIPTGAFTPTFSVGADGKVNVSGLAGIGTRQLSADDAGNLTVSTGSSGNTGDNLGDHTATQNINLNGNKLVGGTTARAQRGGLQIDGNGLATLGAPRVNPDSVTTYGLRLTDFDQDFVLTSKNSYYLGNNRTLPVSGVGDRVMWLSYYSAFRAGGVSGNGTIGTSTQPVSTQWDNINIGQYSVAFGLDNLARDRYSTVFGNNNVVRAGEGTLVTGYGNNGFQTFYGLMMGSENQMKGRLGLVGGYQSKVQTPSSLNVPSLAFGYRAQARANSGSSCFALGYYARTSGFEGCFTLADYSPVRTNFTQDSLVSTAFNQFSARFAGGYRLFTTTATNTRNNGTVQTPVGVELTPGNNAWTVLSDSTKKERRVLADGNRFLTRINAMRLGSWNYIGQSPDSMRHYGPMAQDFFAAFGHDAVGRSGNATTINQADFDGVNLIAIQALYRRLLLLEAENARQQQLIRQLQVTTTTAAPAPARLPVTEAEELRRQNAALQARAAAAEITAARATATLDAFEARLRRLEAATSAPNPTAQARK